jgi:Protein of unknown function (DUF2510)
MAGQPGWYRAPGEDGMLRYWNGTLWTNHRQPAPAPAPAQVSVAAQPSYQPQWMFAPAPTPQFAATALADEPTVPPPVAQLPNPLADSGRNRRRVVGALRGMLVGVVILIIGFAVIGFMGATNSPGTGEVKASGIVTSLGATSGNACWPIATFAVTGKSYTANSSVGISPCPVGLGQTVDVVYSAANPASNAHIEIGTGITQFLWVLPALGALLFFGSLWAFILRAGSIAAGVALVRGGSKRSKMPVA